MTNVEFYAVCTRETTDAILVEIDGEGEYWIPKSQIGGESEVQGEGDKGNLAISEWFATQKGLT